MLRTKRFQVCGVLHQFQQYSSVMRFFLMSDRTIHVCCLYILGITSRKPDALASIARAHLRMHACRSATGKRRLWKLLQTTGSSQRRHRAQKEGRRTHTHTIRTEQRCGHPKGTCWWCPCSHPRSTGSLAGICGQRMIWIRKKRPERIFLVRFSLVLFDHTRNPVGFPYVFPGNYIQQIRIALHKNSKMPLCHSKKLWY